MRIAGATIPDNKRIEIALPYIYGIGRRAARKILEEAKIDFAKKAKDISPQEINKLREIIEKNFKV